MADRYLLESGSPDGYLLEDGSGVLLLDIENHDASFTLTGGGVVVAALTTARDRVQVFTGGGTIALPFSGAHNRSGALTGGGILTWDALAEESVENHDVTFTLTGGGILTSARQKDAFRAQLLTGGGVITPSVLAARYGMALLTGGGIISIARVADRLADELLTGGGILAILQASGRFVTVNLTGGGELIIQGQNSEMALDNLGTVMDAIAAAIETAGITDRTYPYPAEEINVPCAVVGYPPEIEFDLTFNRGADRCEIPVYFIVGRVHERSARDKLATIITGATGIKTALDGNLGGVVQSLRVMNMRILNVQVSGIDYLAAKFETDVIK